LLLGLGLQAYVNGAAWDWWAGGSYGGRRFDSCFAVFAFGLAALLVGGAGRTGDIRPWARLRSGVGMGARAGAYLLAVMLALGNLLYANTQSGPTVPISGGAPAAERLRSEIGGPLGAVSAWASRASNLPARAIFAWRYHTSLSAYDRISGVHVLGELFPGLNSFAGKRHHVLHLDPRDPAVSGLIRDAAGHLIAPTGMVRVLIGLNRLGAVDFEVALTSAARAVTSPGRIALRLNGVDITDTTARGDPGRVRGRSRSYQRGTNLLEIVGPPGLQVPPRVTLKSAVNAAGN